MPGNGFDMTAAQATAFAFASLHSVLLREEHSRRVRRGIENAKQRRKGGGLS